jgi:peptidoglycan/LPS O-acetylase OafA/YrhL
VIVVAHHALLVVPALAAAYFGGEVSGRLARLFTYTPLHLAWAGTEAVFLFFVLSGLVLTRSTQSPRFDWMRYFPSRLTRLYLPVFAVVVVVWVVFRFVPREAYEGMSPWIAAHPPSYSVVGALYDATLITGTSGSITPLWSLQWEVLFSLLLAPIVLLIARTNPVVQVVAALALSTVGAVVGMGVLTYLPMFVVGAVLGSRWDDITTFMSQRSSRRGSTLAWIGWMALCVVLLSSSWIVAGLLPSVRWATLPLVLVGTGMLILGSAHWPPLVALFSSRVFQWLGAVSFSLYLVHEPIVVSLAFLTHGAWWGILVAFGLSFVVAQGFWILIERPAHRFARRIRSGSSIARPVESASL